MSREHGNLVLLFYIGVSVFGIILITTWAINPTISGDGVLWRKPFIGSLFSLICVLGIFATQFPNSCAGAFHFQKTTQGSAYLQNPTVSHHPACQEFSAHVVRVKGRVRCAACSGLLLGAVVSLVGAIFYFFYGEQIESASFLPVWVGALFVLEGFSQSKFKGWARLTLNSLFVLGGFLCLVGIDQILQNLATDLFLVILIVFWILTKIQLSQWDHSRICDNCKSVCGDEQTNENGVSVCDPS